MVIRDVIEALVTHFKNLEKKVIEVFEELGAQAKVRERENAEFIQFYKSMVSSSSCSLSSSDIFVQNPFETQLIPPPRNQTSFPNADIDHPADFLHLKILQGELLPFCPQQETTIQLHIPQVQPQYHRWPGIQ